MDALAKSCLDPDLGYCERVEIMKAKISVCTGDGFDSWDNNLEEYFENKISSDDFLKSVDRKVEQFLKIKYERKILEALA